MEIIVCIVLFVAAAYQDIKKREVSDFLTILAWIASALVFDMQYFVLFFCVSWAIASICERLKHPLMGFGDVLWLPVFASLVNHFNGNAILLSLIAVLISQLYLAYKISWKGEAKKGDYGPPFLAVLLGMLAVAIIAKAFFY